MLSNHLYLIFDMLQTNSVSASNLMAACLLLFLLFLQVPLNSCSDADNLIRTRYEHWIAQHGRKYRDRSEKARHFQIYRFNVQLIDSFNSLGLGYNLTDNKFADLTNEEFKAKIACLGQRDRQKHESPKAIKIHEKNHETADRVHVPPSVDWRKRGAVTHVKNQGQCGSCWAFSAVAALEGINQIKTKKLVSVSEQELLDCDRKGENSGCNGGYMSTAFEFVLRNHGLATESDYPYQGAEKACQTNKLQDHSVTVSGYRNVTANREQSLLQAVASQPVSVGIDAGGFTFQFYSQGVFSGPCGSDLNHGVTMVGYGTDTGKKNDDESNKYWIVKNSWGSDWGEDGYIRMSRDVTTREGLCGIAKMPSFPVK